MDFYDLELDEAIIIQASNVSRYGYDESEFEDEYLQEILLTNKNIIYVIAEEDGDESEDWDVISVPLNAVKIINGQVQVKQVQHDSYGLCLQVQFIHGVEYWRFGVKAKQQIPRWVTEISKAVRAVPPTVTESRMNRKIQTEVQPKREEETGYVFAVHKNENTCFCSNCGAKILRTAKFCSECGTKNIKEAESTHVQSDVVYDGKLHKCRNCGEVLKAFETTCPLCGYELRDTYASAAIRSFAEKMEQLQKNGKSKDKNNIINLIRTYPIPNTKEDLFEFIILAGSNIREDRYDEDLPKYKKEISDAWKAKFEQAYHKALIAFPNDPSFDQLKMMYKSKIKKLRTKRFHRLLIRIALFTVVLVLMFMGIMFYGETGNDAWGFLIFPGFFALYFLLIELM